jgi:hypothetical protein
LFVQSILIRDAGFSVVQLQVTAAAGCPSRLIEMSVADAPERRFGGVRILVVLAVVVRFLVMGIVVDRVLELPRNVVVRFIKEPNQPIDLVPGFLAEAPDGLKGLFRGDWGFVIDRRLSRRCACRRVWCAIPLTMFDGVVLRVFTQPLLLLSLSALAFLIALAALELLLSSSDQLAVIAPS